VGRGGPQDPPGADRNGTKTGQISYWRRRAIHVDDNPSLFAVCRGCARAQGQPVSPACPASRYTWLCVSHSSLVDSRYASGTFRTPLSFSRLRRFVHLVWRGAGRRYVCSDRYHFNVSVNLEIRQKLSCVTRVHVLMQ